MDRTKLIVRRMREEFPAKIGHVNGFWSEKNIFKNWCYSDRGYDDPESEDSPTVLTADNAVIASGQLVPKKS
ncbi:MAG: hypothetical protein ABSF35_21985 [Polyangia bacterium]|jgi:hypothetical protein